MNAKMEAYWDDVEYSLGEAKGIAFDNCHKIYVLMDDEQMVQMKEYEYDPLFSCDDLSPEEMLETIQTWYENSCMLRFVQSVRTNHADPNAGFGDLIPQGAESDESDED